MFIGTTIYALINTAILALMAIGFNLTFGISGIANFAYGALYVLAAYGIWMMLNLLHLPYLIAVGAAVICQPDSGSSDLPVCSDSRSRPSPIRGDRHFRHRYWPSWNFSAISDGWVLSIPFRCLWTQLHYCRHLC